MILETILARLEALGLPYALHEFKDSKKKPAPAPPFVIWFQTTTGRGPDCAVNMLLETSVSVELYTDDPDAALEARLEEIVLPDVEYKKYQAVIDKENMVQTAYEFTFLQKRSMPT